MGADQKTGPMETTKSDRPRTTMRAREPIRRGRSLTPLTMRKGARIRGTREGSTGSSPRSPLGMTHFSAQELGEGGKTRGETEAPGPSLYDPSNIKWGGGSRGGEQSVEYFLEEDWPDVGLAEVDGGNMDIGEESWFEGL